MPAAERGEPLARARAACMQEVAESHRPIVDGQLPPAPGYVMLGDHWRLEHMRKCMRERGWDADPRDDRQLPDSSRRGF